MDGTFNVAVPNLSQLVAAFEQAPKIAAPILQRALSASSAILAKYTTKGIVPWRTGFLATTFVAVPGLLQTIWKPTASYAPFVEFGTKPHVITAVNKEALYWPGAAHPVKSVNHPGTKPNDFMGRIVAAAQPEITATFQTALQQILQAIAQQSQ